jgi:tape measure domain-containing protein
MTTSNIQIVVSQSGARTVQVQLQGVGQAAEKSSQQVDLLNRALELLGTALALDQLKRWSDAWSSASGLVNVATNSVEQHAAVMERLYDVSQKSRSSFTQIVDLYSAAARQGQELGASQNQVIKFTEGVSKALVIQHTTAEQASGALLQLGQMLGTGKVRAQEFNSVNQGLPVIMQTVAKNIDGAGGSVARLRGMMAQGALSSKQFFEAFLKGQPAMEDAFSKASATIGQGLTVINNAMIKYIGELNEASGFSNQFASAAQIIAKNIDLIASAVIALGVAVAVAFAPGAIAAFYTQVVKLFVLINTNPFIALASAVAALVTYFGLVGDKINAGIDDITTYNDVFKAFGETVAESLSGIGDTVKASFEEITSVTFPHFFDDTRAGFAGFLQSVARVFDSMGGLIIGVNVMIGHVLERIPAQFENAFKQAYNAVATQIEEMVNAVIGGVNKLRDLIGNSNMIAPINIEKMNVDAKEFESFGELWGKSLTEGFDIQGQYLEKSLDNIFARAQKIAQARAAQAKPAGNARLDDHTNPTPYVDPELLKKAENQLRGLLNTIAPMEGALLDFAKAQQIVNDAVKVGIIDNINAAEIMGEVRNHYKDILDPVGAFYRALDLQNKALNGNVNEIDSYTAALQFQEEQHKKNNVISDETVAHLTAELEAHARLVRIVGQETQMMSQTVNARRDYSEQLEAIARLLSDTTSNFTQQDAAEVLTRNYGEMLQGTTLWVSGTIAQYQRMYDQINELRQKGLIDEKTADQLRIQQAELLKQKFIETQVQAANARLQLGSGDWADATLVQMNRLKENFTTVLAGMNDALTNFLGSLEDGFANAVGQAAVHAKSLEEGFRDVAKEITSELISAVVKLGIQWVANQVLMETTGAEAMATTATESAAAAAGVATAWASAAALVNAATFGAGADAGAVALAAIYAESEAMAISSAAGFQDGGYTGNGGRDQVSGVVHGQEFVVNADATARNRELLESMNRGQRVVTAPNAVRDATRQGLRITVQNNGTPQTYNAQHISRDEIRLIAEDAVQRKAGSAVAANLNNPNSTFSKSLKNNTLTPRRRSA